MIGVVGAKHMIKKARISAAQAITRASPINGIVNNKFWIETSLAETALGEASQTGDLITSWADISPNKTSISISSVGTGPIYSNSINDVQAVQFDANSSTNYLQINNAAFLNNTDYTIFIVEKRIANNSGVKNYLLGEDTSFAVGYETESTIIQTHSEAASTNNQSNIEGVSSYSNKPRVLTFTHSSTDGNKIYINATLANEDTSSTAKAHLSGATALSTLAIGKGYNGEIGEIAIFDRKLKTSERTDIEDYLAKKWKAPNNRNSFASCAGIVTSNGCLTSCATAVNGTSSTTIANGESKTLTCNQTGYTGSTQSFTCNSGTLSPTPNSSECSCDTSANYTDSDSDGICEAPCAINGQFGIVDGTEVLSGSISIACGDGYDGEVQYSCNNNTINITNNNCALAPLAFSCSGGNALDTASFSGDTIHFFTSGGSLSCTGTGNAQILVVGGGGGGNGQSGGGGAGGLVFNNSYSLSDGTYSVTVGLGGTGTDNGSQSSFSNTIIAYGGGGAITGNTCCKAGVNGGSGSGAGRSSSANAGTAIAGIGGTSYGNDGGLSTSGQWQGSGGGGGAGGDGGNSSGGSSSTETGGAGGIGMDFSSYFGTTHGVSGWFAGGGGGGIAGSTTNKSNALGGQGGGGNGGAYYGITAQNGLPNTGGGGGGNGNGTVNTTGGSGIVIIRYTGVGSL